MKDHLPWWQSLFLPRPLSTCLGLMMKRYTGHWQTKAQDDMQGGDQHSALRRDSARRDGLADTLAGGEAFPGSRWVSDSGSFLSPVQWLLPSSSGLLTEQSLLQAQEGCGLGSEGL